MTKMRGSVIRRIFVVFAGVASGLVGSDQNAVAQVVDSRTINSRSADSKIGDVNPAGAESVTIRVRAIRAETAAPSGELDSAKVIQCARALRDIDGKLRKLPFMNFSLISSRAETVELMRKETFFLSGGNELTVRPLYAESGKVGLWLRWIDSAGAKVLDTRMHLATGESMVAGADEGGDGATVLAIDVNSEEDDYNDGRRAR